MASWLGGHEVDRWRRVCEYECWELDNDVCCDLSPDSGVSLQHCIASRGLQCYINKHNTILLLKVSSIENMFRHLFIMVS